MKTEKKSFRMLSPKYAAVVIFFAAALQIPVKAITENPSAASTDAGNKESVPVYEIKGLQNTPNKPLVIIDGKETAAEILQTLDPNLIESISVLKDEKATAMYGSKADNGVIIVQSKKDFIDAAGPETSAREGKERFVAPKVPTAVITAGDITLFGYLDDKNDLAGTPNKPLVIIDGKETAAEILQTLDPNLIESISVLKDEKATAMYGSKAVNGVIIVQSKKDFIDAAGPETSAGEGKESKE